MKGYPIASSRATSQGDRLKTLKHIALAATLALASMHANAEIKIGYVHLQTVMQSPQFLATGQKLQAEFKPRNAELQQAYKQLEDRETAFSKDSLTMTESVARTKRRDLNNQRVDLERRQRALQEEFEQRKKDELASLQDRINKAVTAVAQSEGYDIVFYNTSAYVGKRVDITDKIIKQLK